MSNAIAIIHKQTIIEQLSQGLRLPDISKQLSITPQAISKQLKDDPDYQAALETCLDVRMCKYEDQLADKDATPAMVDIARVSKLLAHSEFRASVECPKRWGKNADVQVMVAPVFNVTVSNPSPIYTYDSATDQTQGGVKCSGTGVKG